MEPFAKIVELARYAFEHNPTWLDKFRGDNLGAAKEIRYTYSKDEGAAHLFPETNSPNEIEAFDKRTAQVIANLRTELNRKNAEPWDKAITLRELRSKASAFNPSLADEMERAIAVLAEAGFGPESIPYQATIAKYARLTGDVPNDIYIPMFAYVVDKVYPDCLAALNVARESRPDMFDANGKFKYPKA